MAHAGDVLLDLWLGAPGAQGFEYYILAFHTSVKVLCTAPRWENPRTLMSNRDAATLRLFVFQAKNLPSGDWNALLDPYVKVRRVIEIQKKQQAILKRLSA
jgi:hypothetical protein